MYSARRKWLQIINTDNTFSNFYYLVFCLIFALIQISLSSKPATAQQIYSEICDASAAVAIDAAHFLVAHDEEEVLYLYRNDGFGHVNGKKEPLKRFNLKNGLQIYNERESDIEGAAKIDKRVFWITSHGRNKKGKFRKNRYRLFATDIENSGLKTDIRFVGFYSNLAVDLLNVDNWRSPESEGVRLTIEALEAATQLDMEKVKSLAPKKSGLNIEALAALPDNSGLLIGLRNPVPNGKALIIPLLNPNELLSVSEAKAKFGNPISLDLGGRGIRSMDYVSAIDRFVIVAGPINDETSFRLFRWSGTPEAKTIDFEEIQFSKGVSPEALVAYETGKRVQVIHDEGSRENGGVECKKADKGSRSFSDQWYVVE